MPSQVKSKEMKKIEIKFKKNVYEIDIKKLYYILSILKNDKTIKFESLEKTIEDLKEFNLFEEEFLKNMSEI